MSMPPYIDDLYSKNLRIRGKGIFWYIKMKQQTKVCLTPHPKPKKEGRSAQEQHDAHSQNYVQKALPPSLSLTIQSSMIVS